MFRANSGCTDNNDNSSNINDTIFIDVFSDDEPKIAMIAKPKLQVKKVVVKKIIEDSRVIIEGDTDIFDMICNKFKKDKL